MLLSMASASIAEEAWREDRGDLIVLHLYGSYYEMGKQHVALLGDVARQVYAVQRRLYDRMATEFSFGLRMVDTLLLPVWIGLGPSYEASGFNDELNGMADGLGVGRTDFARAMFTLSAGSTVFAATRTATADGQAIIGRNVDWSDAYGLRRPVVSIFHPTNGDMAYVSAAWPLLEIPTVGINDAGFALSLNFFVCDQNAGVMFPQWPHRRALQQARTVEDGIRIFTEVRERGLSGFEVMADATGAIAMVECTPARCAVFRPDGDWFGQANHARTVTMIPFDRYRSPDSFRRRAAMEANVTSHLGSITPEIAAEILRHRDSAFADDSVVPNLEVLNSAVVHPASKILWHSTTMQPLAPYGEMVPFSADANVEVPTSLPADPRLGSGELQQLATFVADARRALRLLDEGDYEKAAELLDRVAVEGVPPLDPARLAWARALTRIGAGKLTEAYGLLVALQGQDAPFEVRAYALVMQAQLADRLGRRTDAERLYAQARTHLDAHREYNTFGELRAQIKAGLERRQSGSLPEAPDLLMIPR